MTDAVPRWRPALVPPILHEESIFGYLQRLALVTASGAMKPVTRALTGVKMVVAPWLLPSHLETFSARLPSLPRASELLRLHTIVPAALPFLNRSVQPELRRRICSPTGDSQGLYFLLGLTHSKTSAVQACQSFCWACVKEDLDRHGFAYWRRHHQFPYVASCGVHGEPLFTGSGCCRLTQRAGRLARLPGIWCRCRSPLVRVSGTPLRGRTQDLDRCLSRMLLQALTHDWGNRSAEYFAGLYLLELRRKGYGHGKYIATPRLVRDFARRFGTALLQQYNSEVADEHRWLVDLAAGKPPRSVVRNMLIVEFLFGSLNGLERAAAQTTPTEILRVPARRGSRVSLARQTAEHHDAASGKLRSQHRKTLRDWRERQGEKATRTRAQRELSTTVNWLRANDWDWYERTLARVSAKSVGRTTAKRFSAERYADDDEAFKFVERRFFELTTREGEPVRVTRARLIDGLWGRQKRRPKTDALVRRLCETQEAFRVRLALWLFMNPKAAPAGMSALDYAYWRTRVPKGRIVEIAERQHRGKNRDRA